MRGNMPTKKGNIRRGWTFWQKRRLGRDATDSAAQSRDTA